MILFAPIDGYRSPAGQEQSCPCSRAGQEGLEPPTRGFGVRCSTIRATALETRSNPRRMKLPENKVILLLFLLRFLVVGVLAAPRAELGQLEFLCVGALVLGRGVVALPTGGAFQGDDDPRR